MRLLNIIAVAANIAPSSTSSSEDSSLSKKSLDIAILCNSSLDKKSVFRKLSLTCASKRLSLVSCFLSCCSKPVACHVHVRCPLAGTLPYGVAFLALIS